MNAVLDRPEIFRGALRRKRRRLDQFREARTVDVVHDQELLAVMHADFVNRYDVRMLQSSRSRGFNSKTPDVFRIRVRPQQKHLHRDDASETHLAGLVNNAHAAARDLLQQLVIAEPSRQRSERVSLLAFQTGFLLGLERTIERTMRAKTFGRARRKFRSAFRTMVYLRHTT